MIKAEDLWLWLFKKAHAFAGPFQALRRRMCRDQDHTFSCKNQLNNAVKVKR